MEARNGAHIFDIKKADECLGQTVAIFDKKKKSCLWEKGKSGDDVAVQKNFILVSIFKSTVAPKFDYCHLNNGVYTCIAFLSELLSIDEAGNAII